MSPDWSPSWMMRDPKGQDLIYVSLGLDIDVYTYPGGVYVEQLTAFEPNGLCVDKASDVFSPEYTAADVLEFAHGAKTPIATLNFPNSHPYACAVDPTTGNLAVASYDQGASVGGSVGIFQRAQGAPTVYTAPKLFFYYFCGYDDVGNLFVDGESSRFAFILAELPKGSKTFRNVTIHNLGKPIGLPGNVQWDGTDLALGDVDRNVVYRLQIMGSNATVSGFLPLTRGQSVNQFFITALRDVAGTRQMRLIGPANHGDKVRYWNYPVGGQATRAISVPNGPFGVVVSPAIK